MLETEQESFTRLRICGRPRGAWSPAFRNRSPIAVLGHARGRVGNSELTEPLTVASVNAQFLYGPGRIAERVLGAVISRRRRGSGDVGRLISCAQMAPKNESECYPPRTLSHNFMGKVPAV